MRQLEFKFVRPPLNEHIARLMARGLGKKLHHVGNLDLYEEMNWKEWAPIADEVIAELGLKP